MGATMLIALALHGGVAMWLPLSPPAWHPDEKIPPRPPLRVSLLATVAETTVSAPPVSKPPPSPEPIPELAPEPEPVAEETAPEPQPVIEESYPDPVQDSEPERENVTALISPEETDVAPLDVAATARYEQLLVAWLEKHKKYPRRARRLRIEGEALLRIVIDRQGQTRRVALERQTGNRLLDKAVLDMAKRADPFPPMPQSNPHQEMEFIVPVVFALR